jgi:hypothetical protein
MNESNENTASPAPNDGVDSRHCNICKAAPCGAVNEYWGVCPVCHHNDGYINIGSAHWRLCEEHKLVWSRDASQFSRWRDETDEQLRATYEEFGFASFTEVQGVYGCEGSTTKEATEFD